MTAAKKIVWLCGTIDLPEFAVAKKWLAERFEVIQYDGKNSAAPFAIVDVREAWSPAAAALLKQLAADFPTALIVQFLGPWCAGMGRTPGYLPDVQYVPWHAWEAELPRVLGILESLSQRGSIGIVAATSDSLEALADAVQASGFEVVRLRNVSELSTVAVDKILIDIDGRREQPGWFKEWLAAANGKPVIVAASFGLMNSHQDWSKRGIAAVLFKPFVLASLQVVLINAANQTPRTAASGR